MNPKKTPALLNLVTVPTRSPLENCSLQDVKHAIATRKIKIFFIFCRFKKLSSNIFISYTYITVVTSFGNTSIKSLSASTRSEKAQYQVSYQSKE